MVKFSARIIVEPRNRKELIQTFKSLMDTVRRQGGCVGIDFSESLLDQNTLLFQETWDTQPNLEEHLRSTTFGILMGAANLLSHSVEACIDTISFTAGQEAIHAARSAQAI